MPNLTDLVQIIAPDRDDEPEDIFASAPGLIFTDDLRNSHGGGADCTVVYKSRRFGDIHLRTAEPDDEVERRLFGHYLWNAGVMMAELIGQADGNIDGDAGSDAEAVIHGDARWSVRDHAVLELGAGVGLGGIAAALAGASPTVLTDYPAPAVLATLRQNVADNIKGESAAAARCEVQGHEWGMLDSEFPVADRGRFTRVLAADCFWMPHQHANLVASMLHFLSPEPSARIFAIAGFHTGRAKLAGFFDEARERGLEVDEIFEEDAEGRRREWMEERDGGREDHAERNKWLVISILKRRVY